MKTHSTTILAVRRNGVTAFAGDGQVTVGDTIFKHTANKLRTMREGKVVAGYAGSAADALALFERLEAKLDEFSGNLSRAVVETAKLWRTDKVLRRLEAYLVVADKENLFLISGNGDIITPDAEVLAIGSGGPFAQAAAMAMLRHSKLGAEEIAKEALKIAAELCLYTNDKIVVEVVK
ncbi:MAG: ATP-dependent protease subunit HslV [candidate division WS1 bacterium]|jgi:ATP-dependent HslUV protease subunit HslV|nr:ATP-dependent protease subunit HslV [candidate division WS1 bacterium]